MDGCVALWGVLMAGLLTGRGCRTALLAPGWNGSYTPGSDHWLYTDSCISVGLFLTLSLSIETLGVNILQKLNVIINFLLIFKIICDSLSSGLHLGRDVQNVIDPGFIQSLESSWKYLSRLEIYLDFKYVPIKFYLFPPRMYRIKRMFTI